MALPVASAGSVIDREGVVAVSRRVEGGHVRRRPDRPGRRDRVVVGQVCDNGAGRSCRKLFGEHVRRQQSLVRRRERGTAVAGTPAATEDVISPEVVDVRPGEAAEELPRPFAHFIDGARAGWTQVVARVPLAIAHREPIGVLREELAPQEGRQVMAAELQRDAAPHGVSDDRRAVGVPAFEHPAFAVSSDAFGAGGPRGPVSVRHARRRVMEEHAVQAVSAGEFQPRRPFIVQGVVAEDERARGERRLFPVYARSQRAAGDPARAFAAGPDPAVAQLFEQRVDAVQYPARIAADDSDVWRTDAQFKPVVRDRAGRHEERDRAISLAPWSKVGAQFGGGVRQHRIIRVVRDAGGRDLFERNGHARIVRPRSGGL